MRRKPQPLAELPLVFKALSDPTRIRLLNLMSEGEACVCHFCEVLELVQPKVSRHLAYLKRAGLVTARREGQWSHYGWSEHPDSRVRTLMTNLRSWITSDESLTRERKALHQIRC